METAEEKRDNQTGAGLRNEPTDDVPVGAPNFDASNRRRARAVGWIASADGEVLPVSGAHRSTSPRPIVETPALEPDVSIGGPGRWGSVVGYERDTQPDRPDLVRARRSGERITSDDYWAVLDSRATRSRHRPEPPR